MVEEAEALGRRAGVEKEEEEEDEDRVGGRTTVVLHVRLPSEFVGSKNPS